VVGKDLLKMGKKLWSLKLGKKFGGGLGEIGKKI